jgi:hypothetical protein
MANNIPVPHYNIPQCAMCLPPVRVLKLYIQFEAGSAEVLAISPLTLENTTISASVRHYCPHVHYK